MRVLHFSIGCVVFVQFFQPQSSKGTSAMTVKPRPKKTDTEVPEAPPATKPKRVRRPSATKTATATKAPAKKASPRKRSTTPAATKATTPADAPKKKRTPPTRPMTEHGFIVGTDSALIADALVAGGKDRNDINAQAAKSIGKTNGLTKRNGDPKYVPSMVSSILGKMVGSGKYDIVSDWKLVKRDRPRRPRKKPAAA